MILCYISRAPNVCVKSDITKKNRSSRAELRFVANDDLKNCQLHKEKFASSVILYSICLRMFNGQGFIRCQCIRKGKRLCPIRQC